MYLHLVTITLSLPDMHHIVKLPRKERQRRTVRAKKCRLSQKKITDKIRFAAALTSSTDWQLYIDYGDWLTQEAQQAVTVKRLDDV